MNILEIYQNNPNTVFISRDGSRYKVKKVDADDDDYPFLMEKITENDLGERKNWVANNGRSDKYCPKEDPDDIVDYERPLNISEIYRNNPNTVFIARDGTKVKVTNVRPFAIAVTSLDEKSAYTVSSSNGTVIGPDKPDPWDIVRYEQPPVTTFTVGTYTTRDGRKAVVYYDLSEPFGMYYPLYGYIDGNEDYDTWTKQGHNDYDEGRPEDLVGPWIEKPYIITVNGKEFHPVKKPKDGEQYFYIGAAPSGVFVSDPQAVSENLGLINLNLVYRTLEEAQAFLEEITKPNTEVKYEVDSSL